MLNNLKKFAVYGLLGCLGLLPGWGLAAEGRYALIIGIGQYSPDSGASVLPGIPKDIENVRKIARSMEVDERNIVELRDAQATRKNIVQALEKLRQQVQTGDQVLIYFSGHGARLSAAGRCSEGLITYTPGPYTVADLLSEEDLARYTQPISQKADKLITLFDSCFSGGVLAARTRSLAQDLGIRPRFSASGSECSVPVNDRNTRSFAPVMTRLGAAQENFVQIAAANYNEVSWDFPNIGGLATHSLTQCLLGEATDLNRSGAVSLDEVRQCAQVKVDEAMKPFASSGRAPSTIQVRGARNLIVLPTQPQAALAPPRPAAQATAQSAAPVAAPVAVAGTALGSQATAPASVAQTAAPAAAAQATAVASVAPTAAPAAAVQATAPAPAVQTAPPMQAVQLAQATVPAPPVPSPAPARPPAVIAPVTAAPNPAPVQVAPMPPARPPATTALAAASPIAPTVPAATASKEQGSAPATQVVAAPAPAAVPAAALSAPAAPAAPAALAAAPAAPAAPAATAATAATATSALPSQAPLIVQAIERPTPAAQPEKPAEQLLASAATLQDIYAMRDGRLKLEVSAPAQLTIDKDPLQFSVRSSTAGYLYAVMLGSDGRSFYLLFPNKLDGDNRIRANTTYRFPRPGWMVKAGGPEGVNHLLFVVSQSPRDPRVFVPTGSDDGGGGPFTYAVTDLIARQRLVDFFIGRGVQGRNRLMAAQLLTIKEVP